MRIGLSAAPWLLSVCTLAIVKALPTNSPRPLVIWHGLGDKYDGEGILGFIDDIKVVHPGIFIHSVYISSDGEEDKKAGFFGKVADQLELVHEQVSSLPELSSGFDAIGFSQGGQFLRAYVELYNSPPINNLITFGAQHMGVADIPACGAFDLLCKIARAGAQQGVYSAWAQGRFIQAQYFRDTNRYSTYLERNVWLPHINNEVPAQRNQTFAANLASLTNLVLVVFSEDQTVIPKESGWFGSYPISDTVSSTATEPEVPVIVPLREQPIYKEDWIGLKALDEKGGLITTTCIGVHMNVSRACWEPLVQKYVGGLGTTKGLVIQSVELQ